MLFFFAGYEIDLHRIAGLPLRLGAVGWAMSLVLAYAIGGVLAAAGVVLSLLYTGSAIATTAIGTLIPILSDTGELKTRFGTYLLAAGAVGEFGPILLITLILSTGSPVHHARDPDRVRGARGRRRAAGGAVVGPEHPAVRAHAREELAARGALDRRARLRARAARLGARARPAAGRLRGRADHAAGAQGREVPAFDSKLSAVAFGVFIPFFFVVSGMQLNIDALFASPGGVVKMFVFFGLFLVVRGTPALVLYPEVLDRRDRLALAFFTSTQLPLVLAITTLALDSGHMRSSTAASLVGAAVLSTLIYPMVGLRLRRDRRSSVVDDAALRVGGRP